MDPLRPLITLLSPAGARARLSILIFHRVLPEPDPIFPGETCARRFDELLRWLGEWFTVLPLDEAVRRLGAGDLPARAAAITFDDGYADNRTVALPILQRHRMPATFFIATGFLDGGRMWNDTVIAAVRGCTRPVLDLEPLGLGRHPLGGVPDRRSAIGAVIDRLKYLPLPQRVALSEAVAEAAGVVPPRDLMMSSDQVREMHAAGMQIGAHTVHHPILARIRPDEARTEIAEGREVLEGLIGQRVGLFAYPNGKPGTDFLPEHARIVDELGFDAAVSTAWGSSTAASDRLQLPRFTPWDRRRLRFGARMLTNLRSSAPPPAARPSR